MRTSFAAGFVDEDRLLLFPVDEVRWEGLAQLRGRQAGRFACWR